MSAESFIFGLRGVSLFFAFLFTSLMLAPLLHYVLIGWPWRKNDIFVSMSPKAKQEYLALFQKDYKIASEDEAVTKFQQFYDKWYGRRHLVFPILFVFVITFIQSYFVGEKISINVFRAHGHEIPFTAIAGFIGVYIWVLWDFITRSTERDLTFGHIYKGALRLLSGIAVGYAFAAIVNEALGPFIAFTVGVFPLQKVQIYLTQLFEKFATIPNTTVVSEDELKNISGINSKVAERIHEAGIDTIPQLAYCDPVQLSMLTNFSFMFINDIVGQAIAWIYLGNKLEILRYRGLRSSYEINTFVDDYIGGNDEDKKDAIELLPHLAKAVELSEDELWNNLYHIGMDPYTEFLVSVFDLSVPEA